MPTVLRWKGHRFYFWSGDESEPPHVHVDKDGKSAKVWLHSLTVAYNDGYRTHEMTAILEIVYENRDHLMRLWNEHFRH